MKQTPELKAAQANMRPGVVTMHGFLGGDGRDLAQILDEDAAAARQLGVSAARLAAQMREMKNAGERGLGEFIAVPPHFLVRVDDVRGKLRCPFGDPGLHAKTNITVTNQRLDKTISFTELNIHFVEAHGFFEGKDSPFRIDPADLAEVLEVPPEPEKNSYQIGGTP